MSNCLETTFYDNGKFTVNIDCAKENLDELLSSARKIFEKRLNKAEQYKKEANPKD